MSTSLTHPDIPAWTVGDRLGKAREWVGLTQLQIADRIGVGRRSIARYESADQPPRAIVLAYQAVTGVPAWWILGEEPTEPTVIEGYPTEGSVIGLPVAAALKIAS